MPITAPNVSRRGTRVGIAPPVDPLVDDAPPASGATGTDVALAGTEVKLEGTPVLIVSLLEPVAVAEMEAELDADSTPPLLVSVAVAVAVDATTELEEDGLSTYDTTMLMGLHCAPRLTLYRFAKPPLRQCQKVVLGPIARELFLQTDQPPVQIAPACGGPSNWNW